MYCTKSMVNAIELIRSTGLQVQRIECDGSLYGLYMHPNLCTIPYIPGIFIYGWSPAVRWEPDSGQFTVYSTVEYLTTEYVTNYWSTARKKGWIAESYDDIKDGIAALAENLRYHIEMKHDAEIDKMLEVLD